MIRVLIVDDSPVVRHALRSELSRDPRIEVVGEAGDPQEARVLIAQTQPQVMTLDVEMPVMDGLSFLREVMSTRPMPVVMCSSLARRSSEMVMECLRVGAVSVVPKPHNGYPLQQMLADLRHAVVVAATARVHAPRTSGPATRAAPGRAVDPRGLLIAVGSSTGGTAALEEVLSGLPATCPPVVVAQHLPDAFVSRFVERLDSVLPLTVRVACHGSPLLPGHVFIAPATHHLKVQKRGLHMVTELVDADRVNFHRPSVDVLFASVASCAARSTVAVMLTGMGKDGARGMLAIKEAGGATIAQDEATCVVYGMPRAAVELGGVDESVALGRIAQRVMERLAGLRLAA